MIGGQEMSKKDEKKNRIDLSLYGRKVLICRLRYIVWQESFLLMSGMEWYPRWGEARYQFLPIFRKGMDEERKYLFTSF